MGKKSSPPEENEVLQVNYENIEMKVWEHCCQVFEQIFWVPDTSLRKTCSYSELFWSTFSRIRTEYGPEHAVRIQDQDHVKHL